MGLHAESPARMIQVVSWTAWEVFSRGSAVHRLEEPVSEVEVGDVLRWKARLGVDELELVAACEDEFRTCFRNSRTPSRDPEGGSGSVRLYGDPEPVVMESVDCVVVELEEWFAAGADDEALSVGVPAEAAATATARSLAVLNFPPPVPSVLTKSVSQTGRRRSTSCSSRPVQRLHPVKRQKTAGLPTL